MKVRNNKTRLENVSDLTLTEILSLVIGVNESDMKLWSDNSITIEKSDYEYVFRKKRRNGYMRYLGFHYGYHIYMN